MEGIWGENRNKHLNFVGDLDYNLVLAEICAHFTLHISCSMS